MYVVYTAIFENGWEYWYYGTYNTRDRACAVVAELDRSNLATEPSVYHDLCAAENAKYMDINNLPQHLR